MNTVVTSTHWDVDDPQDLRLCVDGTDWIFRYETALPCLVIG